MMKKHLDVLITAQNELWKWQLAIGILLMIFVVIPQLAYKFHHPEMTETQLILNFFEAYKELF